jgi:RNA polymerase primary sigma factor
MTALRSPRRPATQTTRSASARTAQSARELMQLRRRLTQLLETEIDFIPNKSFASAEAAAELLGDAREASVVADAQVPRDLPAHLARLCQAKLLSAEVEQKLFRRMNYLKYRANALRATLDPDRPNRRIVERAEYFLAEAARIRDRIVHANMRLVISIVKKYVTPQFSFDEMLSDGIMTLMHVVEKFDYDRGFRFSTYAYRSVARSAYRAVTDRQRESSKFVSSCDDVLEGAAERDSSCLDQTTWELLRNWLPRLISRLDEREQLIIRGRYALGVERKVQTFQSLADALCVSKERVRQLEHRAVNKLRTMAAEAAIEIPVASALTQ